MWLRLTLINFSNRPILWTMHWCFTSKDCTSSAWVNHHNICRREQTCIAPMYCHSSASMPKWLPQTVTRKRNSSKGNSFFCFILRKSQDHNHPHYKLVCCPSVMLKKKMSILPFPFWHHTTDTHVHVVWMIGKFRKVASHICNETAVTLFLNLQGSATPFESTARVSLFAIWSTQTEWMELQNVHRKFFHPIHPIC